jgi:hypothetical protein
LYDTINCIEYSYPVLNTIYFARSKFCPSEVEAHFTTNKNAGTLERMELKRIQKCAHLKLKNELCNMICACKDKRCTYRAKQEIDSRDAQRRFYGKCKEQQWYINCDRDHNRNCACNNKHQAVKSPCIERPGYCDRKDNRRNNQLKKLGYEKPKSNGKVPCPIRSFPDKPAKHSWADCSKNLANQKMLALQSAVNANHAAINNCSLSNDNRSPMESYHTEAADNQSLGYCSSSDYDNAFVTFEAPPPPARKKVAERVKCGNKLVKNTRKAIASSVDNG